MDTTGFLKRFAASLAAQGEFMDSEPVGYENFPRIGRCPVLFLRNRAVGFATALENIVQNATERADLPVSLLRITGIESCC